MVQFLYLQTVQVDFLHFTLNRFSKAGLQNAPSKFHGCQRSAFGNFWNVLKFCKKPLNFLKEPPDINAEKIDCSILVTSKLYYFPMDIFCVKRPQLSKKLNNWAHKPRFLTPGTDSSRSGVLWGILMPKATPFDFIFCFITFWCYEGLKVSERRSWSLKNHDR